MAGGIRSQQEVDALDALGADAVVGMAVYTDLLACISSCSTWVGEFFDWLPLVPLAGCPAGLNARGAQQTCDLLQVKLNGIGAQNLILRKADSGVTHSIHARLKVGDVLLEIDVRRGSGELPLVNAPGHVMEA